MTERPSLLATASRRLSSSISSDKNEFSEKHDDHAPPIGLDMAGHDTFLLGPKVVLLDSFIVDLLNVDTSAQTFKLKLLLNMDWEDDGTIGPEVKNKRGLGRRKGSLNGLYNTDLRDTYKTGKYVLLPEFCDDPLSTTWNPGEPAVCKIFVGV